MIDTMKNRLPRLMMLLAAVLILQGCFYHAYDTDPYTSDVYYGRGGDSYYAVDGYYADPYADWAIAGFYAPFGFLSYIDTSYYSRPYGYNRGYYYGYRGGYRGGYYAGHRHHPRRGRGHRHDGDHERRRRGSDTPRHNRYVGPRDDLESRHVSPRGEGRRSTTRPLRGHHAPRTGQQRAERRQSAAAVQRSAPANRPPPANRRSAPPPRAESRDSRASRKSGGRQAGGERRRRQ
ncbi:MAG: hypothetical protein Tsb002_12020 [Wenzhouxiangellaceae bacterium]